MATLALAAVGAAVGGTLLPTGITLLGATLGGAAIGAQIGAFAGSYVDQILFGMGGAPSVKGPRLSDLHITASTEGAPIPRMYGRVRVGGQVIWADEIEEVKKTETAGGSGKGSEVGSSKRPIAILRILPLRLGRAGSPASGASGRMDRNSISVT